MRWKDWCGGRGFPNNACDVHAAHDEIVDVFEQAIALNNELHAISEMLHGLHHVGGLYRRVARTG